MFDGVNDSARMNRLSINMPSILLPLTATKKKEHNLYT